MITPHGHGQAPPIRRRAVRPSEDTLGDARRARSAEASVKKRSPLGVALPLAREIVRQLHAVVGSANASIVGSVRRREQTVGDLNFVAAARHPDEIFAAFASLPEVAQIRRRGHAQIRVCLHSGMHADLHVVPESSFGAALICFTGSAAHHRALRRVARRRKLELNEYGLFRGERMIAGRTEVDVYRALGLAYVPSELREDEGEIAAARDSAIPPLIEHGDLRGDLRVYVDARRPAAIEAMAHAASKAGLEYVALTAAPAGRSRAAKAARLMEHARAVREWRSPWPGLRMLVGAEVPICKDGSLVLDDAVLAKFDVVAAAIHDHLDQPRGAMTRRIVRAVENPHVDLLVLPPIHFRAHDFEAVVGAAKQTGTVLDIEARSDGLGLCSEDVRKALETGTRLAIGSGAAVPEQLARSAEFGVARARRGWARRGDVLNSLPLRQCLGQLKGGRLF